MKALRVQKNRVPLLKHMTELKPAPHLGRCPATCRWGCLSEGKDMGKVWEGLELRTVHCSSIRAEKGETWNYLRSFYKRTKEGRLGERENPF